MWPDIKNGPPAAKPGDTANTSHTSPHQEAEGFSHGSSTGPQRRRHGDVWREGYAYGFRGALRLAARELDDPHAWAVLDELADRYDLAGGDG